MKKLTAEKCREEISKLNKLHKPWMNSTEKLYLQALEIALPILEQQERGDLPERKDSLKHVGYLFVNSGGGVVYSPSGFGMRGFTCAGKIYGDVSFQPEQQENDGWIEWGGGECPVGNLFSDTVMVIEVRFRTGNTERSSRSEFYSWEHHQRATDIIAYRIIPEQPTNQNGEQ